jgi:hypothetical protein
MNVEREIERKEKGPFWFLYIITKSTNMHKTDGAESCALPFSLFSVLFFVL